MVSAVETAVSVAFRMVSAVETAVSVAFRMVSAVEIAVSVAFRMVSAVEIAEFYKGRSTLRRRKCSDTVGLASGRASSRLKYTSPISKYLLNFRPLWNHHMVTDCLWPYRVQLSQWRSSSVAVAIQKPPTNWKQLVMCNWDRSEAGEYQRLVCMEEGNHSGAPGIHCWYSNAQEEYATRSRRRWKENHMENGL